MRHIPQTVTIVNLDTCSNIDAVLEYLDTHNAPCEVTLGPLTTKCIAFTDVGDITSLTYRKKAHMVAMLSHNNVGPLTLDSEGGVWTTESRMGRPLSIKVGYLTKGPGPMKLTIGDFTQCVNLCSKEEVEAYED